MIDQAGAAEDANLVRMGTTRNPGPHEPPLQARIGQRRESVAY